MPLYELVLILRAQSRQKTKTVLLDLCKAFYRLDCHLTDLKMMSGTALPYIMTTKIKERINHGLYFTIKLYGTPQFKQEMTAKLKYNPDVIRTSLIRCRLH
ncbi:28S ribosomal protein S6, mitochondrial [Oopsacas minuta]|uniref:Small ribosomal subunit protein bS6m n=1 Tax=Oopsacas minuta TaxID=111878 RepID=A0AAV7K090_9METZ|nr:28S ribosomal protein S6, mitochondrial [Oopsacas minuta]